MKGYYLLCHFTEEDKRKWRERYPDLSDDVKDWAIVDNDPPYSLEKVADFYDSRAEAIVGLLRANIEANFANWLDTIAEETGLEEDYIAEIILSYLLSPEEEQALKKIQEKALKKIQEKHEATQE